jgi:hypothetical protein
MSFLPGRRELSRIGHSAIQWLRTQPLDAAAVAAGTLLGVALYFVDDGSSADASAADGSSADVSEGRH